ncbi:MAG: histidine phosphatase family protein [Candidatus Riflebacteria bacterium]|nr:histidine phosphatase family protein [Candidatus Riflebacteria bacterium]
MKICLIRHGETVFNREDRMQGARDIELSGRGLLEAVELGRRLASEGICPKRVYASPVKRAWDTAGRLGFNVPVISADGLRARGLGQLEGLTKNEIRERFPGAIERLIHWDWRPPGGCESLGDIYRRADSELTTLMNRERETGLLLAVTHSGVLEAIVRGWLSLEPTQPLPFPLKNAGAIMFHEGPDGKRPDRVISVGELDAVDYA